MSKMSTQTRTPQWDVADRMSKALRESDVTVAEMATYLGVHRNTIGGWLHGHHEPKRSILILWAFRTGVPLEWLTGKPDPFESLGGSRVTREHDALVLQFARAHALQQVA